MKTRNFILGFVGIFALAWAVDAFWLSPLIGDTPWVIRKNAIYITGIIAMALMSLSMVLALRPVWLESKLGGMDKIYHIHKWAGITAILFGAAHWLIDLSGSQFALFFDKAGKPARDTVLFFMTDMRSISKDLGEWSIYILLGLLVMALIKKIPYKPWRLLHKIMPAIYLALVIHALALTPLNYWMGASGLLIAVMLAVGTYAAIYVIAQQVGKAHKYHAKIKSLNVVNGDVLELECTVDKKWPGHNAGQFAFVRFDKHECAHPFTIASAYKNNQTELSFKVKGLGDYTKSLVSNLQVGQTIEIEGPYGRFNYTAHPDNDTPQVWIAAGIGITPFMAWLQEMQTSNSNVAIDMHYCVRNAKDDKLVAQVQSLCANLPNIRLYVHDASTKQRLSAELIANTLQAQNNSLDIWFCGSNKFANTLKQGFEKLSLNKINFHQEIFEMR